MTALGKFAINTRNDRSDMLVRFAEMNNLRQLTHSLIVEQARSRHGKA